MDDFLETDSLLPEDDELDEMAPEQEKEQIEDKINENNIETPLKLDYSIKDINERAALVDRITRETPKEKLTPKYLEILADYIMQAITKEERKQHLFMTDNRLVTINKRETSLEGLIEKFENGEDGIYNLMTNDKNILLTPKVSITEEDIAEIPGLRELREAINAVEAQFKAATGKRKFLLKKQLIEMRRDQYVLKGIFKQPRKMASCSRGLNKIDLNEERWIDENGEPHSKGLVTFFNPDHVAAILRNYNGLKIESAGKYWNDFFYLMQDFDELAKRALKKQYPLLWDLMWLKLAGKSNLEIQARLEEKHGIKHSVEYISSLWCKKIPKLISEQEKLDYLVQYYTAIEPEKAKWKRCSKCGQIKLAHNKFFSKNNTAKDGFYSICKACRNAKS